MLYVLWLSWLVSHPSLTAPILHLWACSSVRYQFLSRPVPFPFSVAQSADVLLLTLVRVPDPSGVYSSVPAHFLASALPVSVRFIGGSTVHVVRCSPRGAVYEELRDVCMFLKQNMQTACVLTTCSVATFLTGDLAQKVAQLKSLRPFYWWSAAQSRRCK